jgi:hypothetical protein
MTVRATVSCLLASRLSFAGIAVAQTTPPAAAPAGAAAQRPADTRTVARLKEPVGTVLVSQGDAMVAGVRDQRLPVGVRVVTTLSAAVTIDYDKGCDVRLRENQRFTVREGECAALIASVESVTAPVATGTGGTVSGIATLGVVGVAAAIIAADRGRGNGPAAEPETTN